MLKSLGKWFEYFILTHLAGFFLNQLVKHFLKRAMTTEANRPLTNAENIFKTLVWDPIILSGETYLFANVPFLNLPVINQIDRGILNLAADWLFEQIRTLVDVTAIKLVNHDHQVAYDDASIQLMVIAHDKGINSDEFTKARDAAKVALSKFTQFGR